MPESLVAQCQSFTLFFEVRFIGKTSKIETHALDFKKNYDLEKIIVTLVSMIYFDIKTYLKETLLDWISTCCSHFISSL